MRVSAGPFRTVRLADYRPPAFGVDRADLEFDLRDGGALVKSRLAFERRGAGGLVLDGEGLSPVSARLDGRPLGDRLLVTDRGIEVRDPPDRGVLEVGTALDPGANTALTGLFRCGGVYCTQNEPEGFRRITYFTDRPDVSSVFRTRIVADKASCPVLLAGGNLVDSGDLPGGRHFAVWEDPFPKPSYLYAMVAGDLGLVRGSFATRSGRDVDLRIYVDRGSERLCRHAMESLKRAMRWDEERFGLEYDLDVYMIVAVRSFNLGAMENKGLNIFNASCVLADPETATDEELLRVERIVAHEYFHNWTGNRVTCRDWFQITLKEGLTVFREQEFALDVGAGGAAARIDDARLVRTHQFDEDAGPMAHPIKPESYVAVDNFYTDTVYLKGAEVVRMLHALLGEEGFQRGMRRYVGLHDGGAATTEDFVAAMAHGGGRDLGPFLRWYSQAGTPVVRLRARHDPGDAVLSLVVEQSPPALAGRPSGWREGPLHFPLRLGLVGPDGGDVPLRLRGGGGPQPLLDRGVLEITRERETFVFEGVPERPVLSAGRGFSAPVRIDAPLSTGDRCRLLAHDPDPVKRHEASAALAEEAVARLLDGGGGPGGGPPPLDPDHERALSGLLACGGTDPALKAACLETPSERSLYQNYDTVDVEGLSRARSAFRLALARRFEGELLRILRGTPPDGPGRRRLRNAALSLLAEPRTDGALETVRRHFREASTMTDRMAALRELVHWDHPWREEALAEFRGRFGDGPVAMRKWFGAQARTLLPDALERAEALEGDPAYDEGVPDLFHGLWGGLAGNVARFHRADGRGYRAVADRVLRMDRLNPQAAASLAVLAFSHLGRMPAGRRALMGAQLERIGAAAGLSKNTAEVVGNVLGRSGKKTDK